jgi:hypothetical protein
MRGDRVVGAHLINIQDEEEEVVELFVQLWAIYLPPLRNPKVRSSSLPHTTTTTTSTDKLFLIRRDMVEYRQISPEDYHRAGRFD